MSGTTTCVSWEADPSPVEPSATLLPPVPGRDPGWGGCAHGTVPAAEHRDWDRPRAAPGPARRRAPPGQQHLSPLPGQSLGAGSAGRVDRPREQPEPAGGRGGKREPQRGRQGGATGELRAADPEKVVEHDRAAPGDLSAVMPTCKSPLSAQDSFTPLPVPPPAPPQGLCKDFNRIDGINRFVFTWPLEALRGELLLPDGAVTCVCRWLFSSER
ncbi:hypothetical protein J1605_017539 [Eschrichtius robustus]|uniref:Uncharacterized protein n=1 Tax=Eschrichtius robustus TaxID=9764 RepID=A0AB34I070_ESCRO|nr:hypothetical protein J1605_017539 [Eschrichtius robustus]